MCLRCVGYYLLHLMETSHTKAESLFLPWQSSQPVIPHSTWEAHPEPAGAQACPVTEGRVLRDFVNRFIQAHETGQAEKQQLRQWKPTGEKLLARPISWVWPVSLHKPLAWKSPQIDLVLFCHNFWNVWWFSDRALHAFLFHSSLQMMKLVLTLENVTNKAGFWMGLFRGVFL